MRYFLFPGTSIIGTATLIVTSSARHYIDNSYWNMHQARHNKRSHKLADAMETLRLNQNYMHALNDDNKISQRFNF